MFLLIVEGNYFYLYNQMAHSTNTQIFPIHQYVT